MEIRWMGHAASATRNATIRTNQITAAVFIPLPPFCCVWVVEISYQKYRCASIDVFLKIGWFGRNFLPFQYWKHEKPATVKTG
jgi:hypothetical protein